MNTLTQTQMTTERSAPGLSLRVKPWLAVLANGMRPETRLALQRACRQHHQPVHGRYCSDPLAHHIRGSNP